ncbi:MAG: PDZ domain-containing protein [Proteobacteria bacterium]|nr:PDZ domain-containing protein [Pseudomonadota bacterium]
MKNLKIILSITAALLLAGHAAAQNTETALRYEQERKVERGEREAAFKIEMREAEEGLAEAAQRVAELSLERLGALGDMRKYEFDFSSKPRMGVNISGDERQGPVEGVGIVSVTPGSPADEAGMRAGDIITAVNGESLTAESSSVANKRLLEFMQGVEDGDVLDVEYLRDGKVGTVQIEPRVVPVHAFAWSSPGEHFKMPAMPNMHVMPNIMNEFRIRFGGWRGGWGDMEVVELTAGLGRYFGTDSGMLVISAPTSNAFKVQEGDVIISIDGREPSSVNHCMRILGSYQPGEKIVLSIMRDKKRMTIESEIPDDRTGMLRDSFFEPAKPVRVRLPRLAVAVPERT